MAVKKIFVLYSFLLVISAFLGSKVFAINLGVQLSINRILILLSPIMLIAGDRYIEKKNSSQKPYTKLLLIWAVYSLLLLPFVIRDISGFFHHLFFLISALITSYFAGRYLVSSKYIKHLLVGFTLVMLFAAVIGVQEMMTGVYLFTSENAIDYYDTRSALESTLGMRVPISLAGNPNDFGMMMLFGALNSLLLFKIEKKKLLSLLYLGCCAFLSFMVMATQSRSQFISLLLAFGLIIVFVFNRLRRPTRLIIILVVLLSASYILSWLNANQDLYKALVTVNLAEEDYVRVNLIKNGFTILINSMFLGVGVGNIEFYMAQPGLLPTSGVLNLHNWWMEILVSSGVLIFIYYLRVYIKRLFTYYREVSLFKNSEDNYFFIALYGMVSMVVFILASVGGSSIFATEWVWAYFVMLFLLPELKKMPSNDW